MKPLTYSYIDGTLSSDIIVEFDTDLNFLSRTDNPISLECDSKSITELYSNNNAFNFHSPDKLTHYPGSADAISCDD